jgi:hypothetical protein
MGMSNSYRWGAKWAELWFAYWPADNGNLYVQPHFDIQGTVYVNAHDHWWNCARAKLRLSLQCELYQCYWDGRASRDVVNKTVPVRARTIG